MPKPDTYTLFKQFNRNNPRIYDFLVDKAREAKAAGYQRFGFPYVFNMARWEFGVKLRNTDFELNNDIAPYYARLIMMNESDLYDFFETRSSQADSDMGWLVYKANREQANKPKPPQSEYLEFDDVVARLNYDRY